MIDDLYSGAQQCSGLGTLRVSPGGLKPRAPTSKKIIMVSRINQLTWEILAVYEVANTNYQ